jgi:PAS domain S-box-containing protein
MRSISENSQEKYSFTREKPIVVVEDDQGLNHLICKSLNRVGFTVTGFTDGEGFLDWLKKGNICSLLLLDYQLPAQSGEDLLDSLDTIGFTIPFIMMTGVGDEEIAVKLMKRGARDYIIKTSNVLDRLPAIIKTQMDILLQEVSLKEAQDRLRISEEKYRDLFETSMDAIIIYDLDGIISDANQQAVSLLGYSQKELVGKMVCDLHPAESAEKCAYTLNQIKEYGMVRIEIEFVTSDGSIVMCEVSSSLYCYENRTVIQGIIRDVSERIKYRNELERREYNFHTIFERAASIIMIVDQTGIIHDCNTHIEITGWNRDDIGSFSFFELLNEPEEKVSSQLQSVIDQNSTFEGEYSINSRDGSLMYFKVCISAHAVRFTEVPSVVCIMHDITDQKKESVRQKCLADILQVFNTANDWKSCAQKMIATIRNHMDFEAVALRIDENREARFFEFDGFTSEFIDLENKNDLKEGNGTTCCGAVFQVLYNKENRFINANGSFWTNSYSSDFYEIQEVLGSDSKTSPCKEAGFESIAIIPIHQEESVIGLLQVHDTRRGIFTEKIIAFLENISNAVSISFKRIQDQQSVQLFKALIEEMNDAVYIVDIKTGDIFYCNKAAGSILGYEVATILSMSEDDTSSEMSEMLTEEFFNRNSDRIIERTITRPDGSITSVDMMVKIITFANREYGITIARDVSEKKELQKQLVWSEKMSAIGQLSAGVAHEFNNILAIIKSTAQMMIYDASSGRIDLDDTIKDELVNIDRQSSRGADIVKNLMTFSSPGEARKMVYDVESIVNDVIKLQKKQLNMENITITANYSSKLHVLVDRGQIQQVLLNLVINARHAMKQLGSGAIDISVFENKGSVRIRVTDTGTGFPESIKNKLFMPFFTTKGAYATDNSGLKGTGLGLSVSYKIIKDHGGDLTASSKPGEGAVFTIILPLAKPSARNDILDIDKNLTDIDIKNSSDKNILIIDDERDISTLLSHVIKQSLECNVFTSVSAADALKFINQVDIDAIFLDYMMPGMNGAEFYEQLKKIYPGVPVFVVTGQTDRVEQIQVEMDGIMGVLTKPFEFQDVFLAIKTVFDDAGKDAVGNK